MSNPILRIFRDTYLHWREHNPSDSAAALSFYAIFSMTPLLIILIFLVSIFFGHDIVESNVIFHISRILGPNLATFIQTLLRGSFLPEHGVLATAIGVVTIIIGSIGVASALKNKLNDLWHSTLPKVRGHWWARTINRFYHRIGGLSVIPFLVILVIVSVAGSVVIQSFDGYQVAALPKLPYLQLIDQIISFLLTTSLFAIIYRILPNIKLPWSELILGAIMTSILFIIGEVLISFYLADIKNTGVFAGAGSMVAIMLWIYYSAQIFFFGASFTYVYSKKYGHLKATN